MQADEMSGRFPREVPVKLVERHHVRSHLATLDDREHDHSDLPVLERVLAPNVAAVDETFHRPLRKLVCISHPFRRDPEKTFVTREFSEWSSHINDEW